MSSQGLFTARTKINCSGVLGSFVICCYVFKFEFANPISEFFSGVRHLSVGLETLETDGKAKTGLKGLECRHLNFKQVVPKTCIICHV